MRRFLLLACLVVLGADPASAGLSFGGETLRDKWREMNTPGAGGGGGSALPCPNADGDGEIHFTDTAETNNCSGDPDFIWAQTTNILSIDGSGQANPGINFAVDTSNYDIRTLNQTTTATAGNSLDITLGNGNTSGTGGGFSVTTGTGGTTGAGGALSLTSGAGGGGNTKGGRITILSGAGSGNQRAGELYLTSGPGGATANGGELILTSGDGGATSGTGGILQLLGGDGGGTGKGSTITIDAGDATTGAFLVGGGAVFITAGNGGTASDSNGGAISLTAGTGGSTSGAGGNSTFSGGLGGTDSGGGLTQIQGGGGQGTGTGGTVRLDAGSAGTSGSGGAVVIRGGDAGASSTDADTGGSIEIMPGSVGGTSKTGFLNFAGGRVSVTEDNLFTWVGTGMAAPFAPPFVVEIPNNTTAQTIAAGDTIAADACGTIKNISSASAVTTSTTATFTAPASLTNGSNIGCIMHVCNVGGFNITLDYQAGEFNSAGAADVVLTPNDCIIVGSAGSSALPNVADGWYQMAPVSVN